MPIQKTIQAPITCSGIGLHSGLATNVRLRPAPPDSGIVFLRQRPDGPVPIKVDGAKVVGTVLSTTLGENGTSVHTVEHLLSALAGLEIDNLMVELDSDEIPILDGSAAPFVDLILAAGVRSQPAARRYLRVTRPIVVEEGYRSVAIYPADRLSVDYTIRFDHPLLAHQAYHYEASPARFVHEIARARTFCLLKEVEAMRARGLAQGGSLDNAIVIGDEGVLNPGGLRYPDEFVRHKVLDIIGDLSLLGCPVLGRVEAHCSGHWLNAKLVSKILASPDCWTIESAAVRPRRRAAEPAIQVTP